MGRTLHNRIHLGRRWTLLNLRRLRAAAGFIGLCAAVVIWMVVTYD